MAQPLTSLSKYKLVPVVAKSPQELCDKLNSIGTPFHIVQITTHGLNQVAYLNGDLRIEELKKDKIIKG